MNIASKNIALIGLLAAFNLGTIQGADPEADFPRLTPEEEHKWEYEERCEYALGKAEFWSNLIENKITPECIENTVKQYFLAKPVTSANGLVNSVTDVFKLRDELINCVPSEYWVSNSPYTTQVIELLRTIITPKNVAQTLRDTHVNVNVIDTDDNTALHIAAKTNAPAQTIQTLIKAGVPINTYNTYTEPLTSGTPLNIAARNGQDRIVRMLLDHNKHSHLYDEHYGYHLQQAEQGARHYNHITTANLIRSHRRLFDRTIVDFIDLLFDADSPHSFAEERSFKVVAVPFMTVFVGGILTLAYKIFSKRNST